MSYFLTEGTMKRFNIAILTFFSILLIYIDATAISAAVRSSKDYKLTTGVLREMKPMVTNFKTDSIQKTFDDLMKKFEEATLEYYGSRYDSSSIKYYNLKLELIKALEILCDIYQKRTDEILKATAADNSAVEVFITYDKHSGYATYFNRPFDPTKDVMPYDDKFTAKDYHFFWDSEKVESYLRDAHFNYNEAIRIINDPEIVFFKSRKKMTHEQINYIVDKYVASLQFFRTSKKQALEIYKLKNEFNTGSIQDKYGLRKDQITPIFDDRIPDKFKVDAVDNSKLLYPIELERRKKADAKLK